MKHLYILTSVLTMMFFLNLPAKAQVQPTATLNMLTDKIAPGYSIVCVSDSGKYLAGSSSESGHIFIYDVEKEKATYIDEEGILGIGVKSVTDDGMIIGNYGADALMYKPALWKDGEWTMLPIPGTMGYTGAACSATQKGDIITGWLLGGPMGEACVWRMKNGKYELEILPGNKDWNDELPSWITAFDISADGKVVTGTLCDSGGSYYLPCSWTRNEDGGYGDMRLHGLELCFNLNETKPGPKPEYNDYVTAPMGTPQQAEQIAAFNQASENWTKLLAKYRTGNMLNGKASSVSANGLYISTSMQIPNPNPGWSRFASVPVRFDLADGTTSVMNTTSENGALLDISAHSTNNEGVTFAISTGVFQTWVYTDKNAVPVEMYNWLNSAYGLDVAPSLAFDYEPETGIITEDTVITGVPYISSDQSMLACSMTNPETRTGFINYYIKIDRPTTIGSIGANGQTTLYAVKSTLYVEGNAERISISDISGKTVYQNNEVEKTTNVSHLPKGIYLIRLTADGKDRIYKVALTD